MNAMKKRMSILALLLAMVLLLVSCGGQENKDAATEAPAPTDTPAPTEPPKTEEELNLERDTAAIKLAVEMTKTMMATAGEKEAAEAEKTAAGEESKTARFFNRISKTRIDSPYRAVVLTPTDEQFEKVKALTAVDAEYKIAPALAKFVNLMYGGLDYGTAADAVAAEADASAVGENVIVLLPCQDIVIVSIHNGKATSSLFWGSDMDYPPEQMTTITSQIGITDLTYRNYDGDALKTMMGQ